MHYVSDVCEQSLSAVGFPPGWLGRDSDHCCEGHPHHGELGVSR